MNTLDKQHIVKENIKRLKNIELAHVLSRVTVREVENELISYLTLSFHCQTGACLDLSARVKAYDNPDIKTMPVEIRLPLPLMQKESYQLQPLYEQVKLSASVQAIIKRTITAYNKYLAQP